MSIPAMVNTQTQVGFESTSGTAVAATDKLSASKVTFNLETNIEEFAASGNKFNTGVIFNYEDTSFQVAGKPTFEELPLWLATILDTPTITTPGGATNARNWQFIPDPDGADADESLTIEQVNPVRSFEAAFCMLNQFTFTIRKSPGGTSIDFSGTGFGQEITDGITATAALALIPFIPMVPNTFDVFIDTTAAGLGTTGFTDTFELIWSFGPKKQKFVSLDSSESSFSGTYELFTPSTMQLRFPRNATTSALLTTMRNGDSRFIQLKGTENADLIESGQTYDMQLDFAGKIINADLGENDALETLSLTFTNFNDPTWGQSMEVNVVNDRVSLSGS